jgi:hypothetical protein
VARSAQRVENGLDLADRAADPVDVMLRWALALWVVGLLTAVPYATHYLLFETSREHYALLITFVLFWIFGYWGIASPLIALVKIRGVLRAVERATSNEDLLAALRGPETRDVAIDLIASENHVPRFIAARVYELLERGSRPCRMAGLEGP